MEIRYSDVYVSVVVIGVGISREYCAVAWFASYEAAELCLH